MQQCEGTWIMGTYHVFVFLPLCSAEMQDGLLSVDQNNNQIRTSNKICGMIWFAEIWNRAENKAWTILWVVELCRNDRVGSYIQQY